MSTIAAMPASEALRAFEANVPRVSITSKTTLDTIRIPRKKERRTHQIVVQQIVKRRD
jgi:hypothetical protein